MTRCSKCGAELSDNTKFCSYCGNRMEAATPPPIKADEEDIIPDVPQQEPANETAEKSDLPKSLADKIKSKASEKWHKLSMYGKITAVAMIVFALLCLLAFMFGKTAAAIIAILQIVLTALAVLMKKQIIKVSQSWLHIVVLVFAVILLAPYVGLFGTNYGESEKFAWSDILLADVIPEPKSHSGEILANSEEYLSLHVYKTSAEDYRKYVDACGEKGFTVEVEQSDRFYNAYNADGYKLSLYYDENDSKINISVNTAEEYGILVWPDSTIASMLPIPKSTTGEITQDDEKEFAAYVSNTPIEEFNAYVAACSDAGFNIDASDYDESYSAKNREGYKLSVSYQGNGVISIFVDEPEYNVTIEVECVENLIFSKYDVDIYIDDSLEGTITHGDTETFELTLSKGTHTLRFVSAEDDELDDEIEFNIQKDENLKYKVSCSSSGVDVDTIVGASSGNQNANKAEKDDFDSATNEVYTLAGYTIEIPKYWKFENKIDGGFQRYAETGGKVAMLQVTASEESDGSYPVTFDGLMDDNENMIEAIEATAFNEVTSYEVVDTGVIKGILYKGAIEDQNSGLVGYGEWFTFPSEADRNWCTLILSQTENTDYSYINDFMKIIQSIQPIEETSGEAESRPETSTEPTIEAAPDPVENLTAENCPDLEALLTLRDPGDPSVSAFANKYHGQVIEFDGCVMNMQHHGDFDTRWDVLLGAGDYAENSALGPNFRLTDVNFYDMNVSGGDSVYVGLNVRIVAEVSDYNPNSQLFELDIVSMEIRA